jgi:HD-GYP domain-containing protein (c-di-GMP phosphodiesterase class II)
VAALIAELATRDGYTASHAAEVVELCARVGRRLGMDEHESLDLELAALLHDIGKLGVDDAILNKRGPLDEDEMDEMRAHAADGAEILARIPGLAHAAAAVRAHHERWDGSGYPDRLEGDEIPLASRVIAACDAYRAMMETRPYRGALGHPAALAELRAGAGSQFDPLVVAAVLDVLAPARAA